MTTTVVCFGEALIDFLNTGKSEKNQEMVNDFVQFPGGAPANVAVAAAKLGCKVHFVGQVGKDLFGDFLINSMQQYGVDTSYTLQHPTAKTALAFVMLDDKGERSFSFYRDNSADMIITENQLDSTAFNNCGVFHFCSNTLVEESISKTTYAAIYLAKLKEAVISFDVNLRHNLWNEELANIGIVNQFVEYAKVVKYSRDEFEYLCENSRTDYLKRCFNAGVELILITDGGKAVEVLTRNYTQFVDIPSTDVVDTTAGGDGFSGGMLYAINKHGLENILNSAELLNQVVNFAVHCGAVAVSKAGAFPSLPKLTDINPAWRV